MAAILLILRPQPGATATATRARSRGLSVRITSLFSIRPEPWQAPDPANFDAVLLTSANAPREAGAPLASFTPFPCYAVGNATAEAAQTAGFENLQTGASDAAELLDLAARRSHVRLLHLCGRDHIAVDAPGLRIERVVVYASEAEHALPPEAIEALAGGAVALLHSARAGSVFSRLVDEAGLDRSSISVAAISAAASEAAGAGWKRIAAAEAPRDEALLELAAKLCQTRPRETGNGE